MTTKTRQISFEKLIPTLKRFALSDNKKNRKAIQSTSYKEPLFYAYYDGQYINVTDAITLFRINVKYVSGLPGNEPFLYDLNKKQIIDNCRMDYPNVERLIPHSNESKLEIDFKMLNEIRQPLKEIRTLVKDRHNKYFYTSINNTSISLSDFNTNEDHKNMTTLDINHNNSFQGENVNNILFNVKRFSDALMTAEKFKSLSNSRVSMEFNGIVRPMTISQDDIYTIVVLPVRPI